MSKVIKYTGQAEKRWGQQRREGNVGFKDFGNFNQVMLAKQLWLIITRPQSLVARILKEKYFRHVNIMEENTKSNYSYMRQSILVANDLIK